MTYKAPSLVVKRLIVKRGAHRAYDQEFFLGPNIIRGDNGTGKSTIMDLMYYVLGGDLKAEEWTKEQLLCDEVICEAQLGINNVVLKRRIDNKSQQPLDLYGGDISSALGQAEGWLHLPYKETDRKRSFSQYLFELMGLPLYKKEEGSNLTMHQILRLLYVDQITSPNKILKEDRYDNVLNRRAIWEYLLGIDDLEAHSKRQLLNSKEKEFNIISGELNAIYRILGKRDLAVNRLQIQGNIQELEEEKKTLIGTLKELPKKEVQNVEKPLSLKIITINEELSSVKSEIHHLEERKKYLITNIVDSEFFQQSLVMRLNAINDSQNTSEALGELQFKYCPSCLTPVAEIPEGHCSLCKAAVKDGGKLSSYLSIKKELEFQIKESQIIVENGRRELIDISNVLSVKYSTFRLQSDELELLSSSLNSFTEKRQEISLRIGYVEKSIEELNKQLFLTGDIEELQGSKSQLNTEITTLKDELRWLDSARQVRKSTVLNDIGRVSLDILSKDLGYEEAFQEAEELFFDFVKDEIRLDGRSRFSASSMVYLKNALRFSIFYQSVTDSKYRYPRFLIVDNVEDKGMQPERSQNFQRLMVEYCQKLESDYQLIFTTSMIDPGLDKSEYCRGKYYKRGEHTLE